MLHSYHFFKDFPDRAERETGMTQEQNVLLMIKRYEECVDQPFKMKANRELMMMQKVLLRDAYKTAEMGDLQAGCPLKEFKGVKRIEVYDDELKLLIPEKKDENGRPIKDKDGKPVYEEPRIDKVAMSSEPHRNFFLIGMNGIVQKYDLVTKELLFSFKSPCSKALLMYDFDDKIVCADEHEIRLWDFFDNKEEAPQLLTVMQAPFKIDHCFSFNICKQTRKSPHYTMITNGGHFQIYVGRLEDFLEGDVVSETLGKQVTIESADYWMGEKTGKIVIGTSDGRLLVYDTETKALESDVRIAGENEPVSKISGFVYIENQPVFLVLVNKKELFLFEGSSGKCKPIEYGPLGEPYKGLEICNIQVAYNSKFFAVGFPKKRAFGVFKIDRERLKVTPPPVWITKVSSERS